MEISKMTKVERVRAAISGQPVDTIPYSIWTHIPMVDLYPEKIAEETYNFYKKFDVDLIKTMNNGMYSVEDFGCEVDFSAVSTGGVARITKTPINVGADWFNLKPASVYLGALKRELTYLSLLLEKLKDEDVPVIFTVFSPFTTARKLSNDQIVHHISNGYEKAVCHGLEIITETTCALVEEAIRLGVDGIFLGSQMSTAEMTSETLYLEYGKPYDLQVLAASQGWCNVLHAHGEDILFNLLKDYPVQIFNWHAWESLPEIDEVLSLTGKCLMAGINRMDITNGRKNKILHQIYRTIQITKGRNLILAPGCVIRYPLDEETLSYIKQTKLEIEKALL